MPLTLLWLWQGYLWKRGHLRRNWAERWFQLQPSCLCYFGSEECKEKRGVIPLDAQCCVEVRAAGEGVEHVLEQDPEGLWCSLRARGQEEGKAGSPSDFPT